MPKRALATAALLLNAITPAAARPASELSCIEAMFNDEQAIAMAQMGSSDEALAKAAGAKVNFLLMGMTSRMCAKTGGWSENEYANSIGYMMAWPTAKGLRLLGEAQGYAAIERAWRARAGEFAKAERLSDAEAESILTMAQADGLVLAEGENARRDARRYADALHQSERMRADFAANKRPRPLDR
jgi:hypothetical protein